MKKLITKTLTHPLFSSSFIMFFGSNLVNGINYAYHLLVGRMLGPSGYGELSALFSLIGLISMLPMSFSLVVVKFVASAKNDQELRGLIAWFKKRVYVMAAIFSLGVIAMSQWIAGFMHFSSPFLIILIGLVVLFSFPLALNRSILHGLIRFSEVVASLITEGAVKLLSGVALIGLGYGVGGAMWGIFLSVLFSFGITSYFLRNYNRDVLKIAPDQKQILRFSLPVLIQTAAVTSLFSVDLILVKHFFSSFEAGIFAAVSTLGKIILFASAPVGSVMFPLVTSRFVKGEKFLSMFLLSMGATGLVIIGVTVVYYLFPQTVMSLLYGDKYSSGVSLLVPYALFAGLLSLTGLFINFFLSVNHHKIVVLPLIAAALQLIGIWLFHSDIAQVVWVSLLVAALLFAALSVYFLTSGILNGKTNKN